ncbi:pentapeptide repeat-containing protein [Amycolatopsis australiensis]|uniref:Uncharacterized protein YjbI, contains pentapeptide repeats n=1 Tax=Amycolatopsis australiensis TaxID=546364 RepID=A0A1K1S3T8_9PSEU|nr:pentapeptide repeat-containing protein [Amycolatopsis australiensis]SFW78756.1 Uncharacterized protein YjbI, contains pentapeptide repeats [Amycolatopsis australiensis]
MTDDFSAAPPSGGAARVVHLRQLTPVAMWTTAAVIAVLSAGAVVALWWPGTAGLNGAELVTARLEALKIGLSIGVGSGGVVALYLAWRRQHATEAALAHQQMVAADTKAHQERVAEDARADATARRITELYSMAVAQLGSEVVPVRLGGLYALERLAQDNETQRQTIVDMLCAYLRMPFPPPDTGQPEEAERAAQERQVRLTAQTVLARHLRPGPDPAGPPVTFWPDTDVDLAGAQLADFDFAGCRLRTGRFSGARFAGPATFAGAQFGGDALFAGTSFADAVRFDRVSFDGDAPFEKSEFLAPARFDGAQWARETRFEEARFAAGVRFGKAVFRGASLFTRTSVFGGAEFGGAAFADEAVFEEARFDGRTSFSEAKFAGKAEFGKAVFGGAATFAKAVFDGPGWFTHAGFGGADFGNVRFAGGGWFHDARFAGNASFDSTAFAGGVSFAGARFGGRASFHQAKFERPVENTFVLDDDGQPPLFERTVFGGSVTFDRATFLLRVDDLATAWARLDRFGKENEPVWPPGWTLRRAGDRPDGVDEGIWGHPG